MALDAKIVKMLNDFADSQPALRLPTFPAGSSNPNLGTTLDEALDAAAGSSSADDAATSASEASDSASDASDSADAAAASAALAANAAYVPTTSADWDGDPATIKAALDRLAAAVAGLLAVPIP